MKKSLLLSLFSLVSFFYSIGQTTTFPCGFDIVHQQRRLSDSSYNSAVMQLDERWKAYSAIMSSAMLTYTSSGYVYEIPIVVHVLHTGGAIGTTYNPDSTTLAGMVTYLNKSYAAESPFPDTTTGTSGGGTRIPLKFVLAKRTPTGGSTNGIIRINASTTLGSTYTTYGLNAATTTGVSVPNITALSRWNSADYYNVYIVNKIDGNDLTSTGGIAGFAYFPGAPTLDGMYVVASQAKTGTTTVSHEFGHAFSLYHTFEGDAGGVSCPSTTSCSTTGDLVCDTEPHIRSSSSPGWCPSSDSNPCTGGGSYNKTQFNIMDYTQCPPNRYTAGQRTRVMNTLDNERVGYKTSSGLLAPSGTIATAICTPTASTPNQPIGPYIVEFNGMKVWTGSAQDENANYVDHSYTQQSTVRPGSSYTISVTTRTNAQNVKAFIDYNNDGDFIDAGEEVFSHGYTVASGTEVHTGTITIPTSGVTKCTYLRMRVVAEFGGSTISNWSCGPYVYGQAEDYAIYVQSNPPTVTTPVALCQGVTATTLTATGTNLKWYTAASGGTGATSLIPSTSSVGSTKYYVSQSTDGSAACESARDSITVTVNALPTIGGTLSTIVGSSSTLSGSGTAFATSPWTSSATGIATVSSTGVVSGLAPGTTTITYKNNLGCSQTAIFTVTAGSTISGTLNACVGSTSTLTGFGTPHATTPWSSSSTAVATVSSVGVVRALSAGTATITYTDNTGTSATATFTVNPAATISGNFSALIGATSTLSGSGTAHSTTAWTSSNTRVATISGTGIVTAVGLGKTLITYTNSSGCTDKQIFSVEAIVSTSNCDFIKMNTGDGHSIGIKPDSSLWAWGYNGSGQLGNGTLVDNASPILIDNTKKWKDIESGEAYNLALTKTNVLYAWGENLYGQLGDGTTTNSSVPKKIGTDSSWLKLANGRFHSLAIKTNGTLWAWGRNNIGQLGDGTTTNRTSPVQIGTDSNWVDIAGGFDFSVGIKNDGTLWAWGYNAYGQFGNGTTTNSNVPIKIGTGTNWLAVNCGFNSTHVIQNNGTLWAAGDNSFGQLGDATTTSRVSLTQIGTDSSWARITSGDVFTIALKSNKSLWAWGYNVPGVLGDGTYVSKSSPTRIGADSNWALVNSFYRTTGAIKTTGALYTWGWNFNGAIGDGTTTDRNAPTLINPVPAISGTLNACVGQTSTLSGSGTAHATTPWSSSNTAIATVSSAGVVTGVSFGTVTITFMNSTGCTKTASFTVNSSPSAPTVSTPITYCQGATAVALTATKSAVADTLLWYTVATGGTAATTAPIPNTTSSGTTNYYVSEKNTSSCESSRTLIAVTVTSGSAAPSFTTPVTYCQDATGIATLSATGSSIKWYTAATGGTASTTAPTPASTTPGITNYYVTQTIGLGCESFPRSLIEVVINPKPVNVTAIAASATAICIGDSVILNGSTSVFNDFGNTTYLQGSSASGSPFACDCPNGSVVVGYEGSTGALLDQFRLICKPINRFGVLGATTSVTTYNGTGAGPVVTAPILFAGTGMFVGIKAIGTTWPGPSLYTYLGGVTGYGQNQSYITSYGDNSSSPITLTSMNGWSSSGDYGTVFIPRGTVSHGMYSFSSFYARGVSLRYTPIGAFKYSYSWSSSPTTDTNSSLTVKTSGSYSLTVTNSLGCSATSAPVNVNVYFYPGPPTVSSPIQYCLGGTATPLTATKSSSTDTLYWYTTATGGIGSTIAPTPSTSASGTTDYFVSEKNPAGCESTRTMISVIVDSVVPPFQIVTTDSMLCLGETTLLRTGTSLKDSINAPYTGGFTNDGLMFDVKAKNSITINSIDMAMGSVPATASLSVYYKAGAYAGYEGTSSAWTLLGSVLPTAGVGGFYNIPVPMSVNVMDGQTVAFYLAYNGTGSVLYNTGTGVGNPTFEDGNMQVLDGRGVFAPLFGGAATPRALAGKIRYTKFNAIWSTGATTDTITVAPTATTKYWARITNWLGCNATDTIQVQVNPLPTISGTLVACVGQTSTLSGSASPHPTTPWTSSNTAIATVSSTGVVTGVSAGTATITYRNANDCIITSSFNVIGLPSLPAVSSPITYCQGATTSTLSATAPAGASLLWYTSAAGGTGSVTAPTPTSLTPGIFNFYVAAKSLTSPFCEGPRALITVVVNPKPDSVAISTLSSLTFCTGDSVTLIGNTKVFNGFGNTSYLQGSSASGTPTVCDCPNGYVVSGYQGNSGGLLDRFTFICKPLSRYGVLGATTTLTSYNGSAAGPSTYGPFTFAGSDMLVGLNARNESWSGGGYFGEITAYGQSQAYITALGNNSLSPSLLSPVSSGNPTTSLGNIFTPNGTVASGMFAYPTLYSSGVSLRYTPIGAYIYTYSWSSAPTADTNRLVVKTSGSYTLTVTNSLGCSATSPAVNVTVNPLPIISGTLNACIGFTSALTGSATAHPSTPWTSSNTAVATVSSTGVVSGVSAGTTTITYMNNNGCAASVTFTVNALPSAPTVTSPVTYCQDATASSLAATGISLKWYTAASGGTASTTAPTPSTTTPGIFTYYVTQSNAFGCENSPRTPINVTVNPKPVAVTATPATSATFCIGDSVILNGSASVFSNFGNTQFFNAPSATGTVYTCDCPSGFAAVGYEGRTGSWMDRFNLICKGIDRLGVIGSTTAATITNGSSGGGGYNGPYLFTGTNLLVGVNVKSQGSAFLNDITGYGQSLGYIVALGDNTSSPVSLGMLGGGSPITNLGTGWAPNGSVITGMYSYPTAYSTGVSFRYTPIGAFKYTYLWSSSATDTNSSITVKTSGTYTLTVTNSLGCSATSAPVNVIVNPLPTITGVLNTCVGQTSTLTGSGTPHPTTAWTSSNTSVATVSATGIVTGVSGGTVNITYMNNNGCVISASFVVNPLPVISGTLSACVGQSSTLSGSATAHATTPWTSSNTAVATVTSTGVVTGVSGGSAVITYRNTNGCTQSVTFTVHPLPSISGTLSACVGSSSSLTGSASPDGTTPWTSSNTSIATISSTGVVAALAVGTTTITYKNSNGCTQTATFTVNPLPTISGTFNTCIGSTSTLTGSATPHATTPWVSSNTAIATVSATGVVTGVSAGTVTISYMNTNGCVTSTSFTVNPLPTISGTLVACVGQTSTLTGSATAHATTPWTSSNTAVAIVSSAGVVTGISGGTAIITYRNTNGCTQTATFLVNPLPTISGTLSACAGQSSILTGSASPDATTPWTSSNTSVATVSSTGVVSGLSAGTAIITYKNSNGCVRTATFTVNPLPLAPTVTTPVNLCIGVPASALTATGTSLKWYTVATGGTSSTTAPTPSTTALGTTNYYVSQTNTFGCEGPRATIAVTVQPSPVVSISSLSPYGFIFCKNLTVSLKANSATAVSWQWDTSGIALSGRIFDTVAAGKVGKWGVTVRNVYGCKNRAEVDVYMDSTKPPILSPTAITICEEGSALLTCSPGFVSYTFEWMKENVFITPSTLKENLKNAILPGNYSVRVTNNYGCIDTTNIAVVNTYPKPLKPVITNLDPILEVAAGYLYYQWYHNNKQIPGANSRTYLTKLVGDYFVEVTDENGCLNNSDTIKMLQSNTVKNISTKSELKIYPNPTKEIVYIESPINIMVRVTDVIGRVVYEGKNPKSVSLANLADGQYFFRISDENDHLITVEKVTKIE